MKTILLAAAIALAAGGAAIAQDATAPGGSPTTNPDASASQPDTTAPATPPAAPDASAAPAPDASAPPATPDASAAPATPDAGTAPAPSGGMSSGGSMPADTGATPPTASTDSYPRCSKTVTDKCSEGAGAKHMTHRKPHRK